jgi:protein gp37
MGEKTKIDWTDSTWNPLRGCNHVSEGCRSCYAEKMAARFCGPGQPYESVMRTGMLTTLWNGNVELVENHLLDPLKWGPVHLSCASCGADHLMLNCPEKITRPRRIFVNSMSDLFHENVTNEMRDRIFAVMALCPQHIFQVLTKRPERMLAYLSASGRNISVYNAATSISENFSRMSETMAHHRSSGNGWWTLPNVWLGVSVENQAAADERIPLLLQTPAEVRFVSCEPLLGAVDLTQIETSAFDCGSGTKNSLTGDMRLPGCGSVSSTTIHGKRINWVIAGGESGPGARPMHPDRARGLWDQCEAAGVPFFFKSWGEWLPVTDDSQGPHVREVDDHKYLKCGKKSSGFLLDGVKYKQFPEVNQ